MCSVFMHMLYLPAMLNKQSTNEEPTNNEHLNNSFAIILLSTMFYIVRAIQLKIGCKPIQCDPLTIQNGSLI